MPSTENKTLERIQREIMDVMEREKELRNLYNNNNEPALNGTLQINGCDRPPLTRAQSTSVLLDPESSNGTSSRRFTSNPNAKGVMQKFFKSRGKLAVANTILRPTITPNQFVIPDFQSPKVILEPGKRIRNGFVPVEERMRKEIQDAHNREKELRTIRRKSQPDFEAILDLDMELDQPSFGGLRATKSMAQLYDSCENLDETVSAPCSLKQARSLAELCDVTEDEIQTPQSLIMQFEQMIIKNQQARA